jgi:hypothetical protein
MMFRQFVVRHSQGVRFPECPAKLALLDVTKRIYGTSVPAALGIKLKMERRKSNGSKRC